ncbi:MAG: hypothetical protein KDA28_17510, partial [Phycisphaerales bacterium]|nr:hypothetical protein [Phycisphaerales bacterium]
MKTIGIDLGGRCIRMAEVTGSRLTRTASIPRSEGDFGPEDGWRVHEALYRHGFSDADLVVGAPSEVVRFEVLPLPPAESGAPIDQIVRLEMARMHRLDP